MNATTITARLYARMLELPLLVRSGEQVFGVFFRPFPRQEILDYLAHGLITAFKFSRYLFLLKDMAKKYGPLAWNKHLPLSCL